MIHAYKLVCSILVWYCWIDEDASIIKRQKRAITLKCCWKRGQSVDPFYDNLMFWAKHSSSGLCVATEHLMCECLNFFQIRYLAAVANN